MERAKNRTIGNPFQVSGVHRRRINTEEKIVAAVWGTEFIQFLATLASYFALYRTIFKNRMNLSFSSYHPVTNHHIFQTILEQNSLRCKEFNKFCPPKSRDDLCLFFCIYPSFIILWWCGVLLLGVGTLRFFFFKSFYWVLLYYSYSITV